MTDHDVITVREARVDDAVAIATIHVRTWQRAYQDQLPADFLARFSVDSRTRWWQDNLAHPLPGARVFVAEVGGVLVGFCAVGKSRNENAAGEVYALYVDSTHWGEGIGTALMRTATDYLRKGGYERAVLWVLESNLKAQRFYEMKGWSTDGVLRTEERQTVTLVEVQFYRLLSKD